MPRTTVNLDPEDKAWLDREARTRRVPRTELVRQAVRGFRVREERRKSLALASAPEHTVGVWRQGDGLAWQNRLRDDWESGG